MFVRRPLLARAHKRHITGKMNATEKAYLTNVLMPRHLAGEISEVHFERLTFLLADDCRYTPDFWIILADGSMECHEIKGSWKAEHIDDSKVKCRVAAEMFQAYRWRFVEYQQTRRMWSITRDKWFGPHGAP